MAIIISDQVCSVCGAYSAGNGYCANIPGHPWQPRDPTPQEQTDAALEHIIDTAQLNLKGTVEDAGIGIYECGGMIGVDRRPYLVVTDETLTVEMTGLPIIPGGLRFTLTDEELTAEVALDLEKTHGDEAGKIWSIYRVEQL